MKKLLIIQNISHEGLGLFEPVLRSQNIAFDLINLHKEEKIPALAPYKALVVLGGPDSANDETDKMRAEVACVAEALGAGMPYLGICLGLQVLVKAAGGQVVKGEVKEVGFINPAGNQHTISLTSAGRGDPLFIGLSDTLNVFQLHGETVVPTPAMAVLATGQYCENQVVKVAEKAYGIQSHFELTPEMLEVWAEQDPDLLPIGKEKLMMNFRAVEQSYTETGHTLFRNFLKIAEL